MIRSAAILLFAVSCASSQSPGWEDTLLEALVNARNRESSDAEKSIDAANAYFSLMCAKEAAQSARAALETDSSLLEAEYLVAASLAVSGETKTARSFAEVALDGDAPPGHARSGLVGLVVALKIEAGDMAGAKRSLLRYEPSLQNAANLSPASSFETLPAPPHAIAYLANLEEAAGNDSMAAQLRRHLLFITEDFLKQRSGGALRPADHWILASSGGGRMDAKETADRLASAWQEGFRSGWPFNYGIHAAFAPYRGSQEFRALFDRIEQDVAESRRRAFGNSAAPDKRRAFNGMMVGAIDCIDRSSSAVAFR